MTAVIKDQVALEVDCAQLEKYKALGGMVQRERVLDGVGRESEFWMATRGWGDTPLDDTGTVLSFPKGASIAFLR